MSNEKFKVGDLVEIKSWDEMAEEFGIDEFGDIEAYGTFTTEMKYLCGKRLKIESINELGFIQNSKDGHTISTDMIKKVDLHKKQYPRCNFELGKFKNIEVSDNGMVAHVKSEPSFELSPEEVKEIVKKARNMGYNLYHDIPELVKKQHEKYEVISGIFEGFIGEIVDSNKGYIGLGNEFGEKCYVKRDNIERVRTNYIDEKISYGRKLRNGTIEVLQDKNKTRVKIIKDDKTFIGEARCMKGDNFNRIKGRKIATKRAYIKFHQYKVTKLAEEMTENVEISKEYIKYKTGKIFFKMNRILQLKEELKELYK